MSNRPGSAFDALSEANRQEIVELLARQGEATSTGLSARLGISRQAVSKHFAALKRAGLVSQEKRGRETIYRLLPDPLQQAQEWLLEVGRSWDRRLRALHDLFQEELVAPRPSPPSLGEGLEVDYSIVMRVSAERAYDAFATGTGLDAWFTSGSEVEARPGGRILFRWKDWGVDRVSLESGGPVVRAERPREFAFRWNPVEDQPRILTTVQLTFQEDPRGTVVRVRDGVYPDTEQGRRAFAQCAAGWGEALTLSKFHLEHGLRY